MPSDVLDGSRSALGGLDADERVAKTEDGRIHGVTSEEHVLGAGQFVRVHF